ncbi:motility associated factor glycosyltransferase family protein [Pseudaeromonas paramecii]|uniref:DUF115 domain-containing protein n=1 Tax=Pseudaeromonas paramecii TaxID=2138166 RepID=A0ABP8Q2V5_9GAMM
MDINKLILKTEKQADKLRLQSAQEKAMAEVLPIRFAQNIVAFERFIPDIANTFRQYSPNRAFRFFCNENGIPNLIWLDDNIALYGDDPHLQAQEQIEEVITSSSVRRFNFGVEKDLFNQIHVQYLNKMVGHLNAAKSIHSPMNNLPDSIPMAMMFGVGLGYQLGYLYERCKIKNLFIFEPDIDLFYASLFTFDWAPLLSYLDEEKLGIHIFIGQDEENIMADLLIALNKRGAFWSANMFGFWHYPSKQVFSLVERVAREFYMLSTGWGFFDDNLFALAHSAENIALKTPFLLKGKKVSNSDSQVPVFVVGNGPSLDVAIPFIKKYQDRAIIVSCGSSISALHKQDIKPDIYVAIERTKAVPDFIGLLGDKEYLRDILFLSSDVIHPDCHQYFDRMAVGFKPNEPMYSIFAKNFMEASRFEVLNFINPLVGNIGIGMPVTLGFKNIYLFGLDNGYKDKEHHHSKHSAYYDADGKPIDALTKIVSAATGFTAPGNFGGTVITNRLFAASARVMESLLKHNDDVNCHNCSDGALVVGAKPLLLSELQLSDRGIDKKAIVDSIYCNMFSPLPVEPSCLPELLDVDGFVNFVNRLISEWQQPYTSRDDICERMQRQFGYLVYLAGTRSQHIYRVLIGTVNYLFALLSTALYLFDDETVTAKMMNELIAIMIEYLEETKVKYPQALVTKDTIDCEIVKLYRNNSTSN